VISWPLTISDGDAVIVPDQKSLGLRFMVYDRLGVQFACGTYAEAEARALSHAEQQFACVWFADERGLQLVGSCLRSQVLAPNLTAPE
jgi:hypothetical protein